LDDEPEHERYFAEEGGLRVGIRLVLNLRQQYARKDEDHPGEAGEGEPDAQEARQDGEKKKKTNALRRTASEGRPKRTASTGCLGGLGGRGGGVGG